MRGIAARNRSRLTVALTASALSAALWCGATVAAADEPGIPAPAVQRPGEHAGQRGEVVGPTMTPPAPPAAPQPAAPGTPDDSPTHAPARSPAAPAAWTSRITRRGGPAAAVPVSTVLTDMPEGAHTGITPELNLREDGHGVRTVAGSEGAASHTSKGHIPPEVLGAAFAEAKSLATLDMGTPDDATGSILLDFLGPSPAQDVHLIAYGSDTATTLSHDQQAHRARFAALREKLRRAFVADK